MTSEAQARLREQDEADARPGTTEEPDGDGTNSAEPTATTATKATKATKASADEAKADEAGDTGRTWRRGRTDDRGAKPPSAGLSLPLVPFLAGLLVLLLAGTAFLWFTRPQGSAVGTTDYVQALEAARSEVVDLTSFDYVTLDEDIARIKRVSIGDLQKESVDQLDKQRQQLTQAQAVVNTEVVGAGVTRADSSDATVLLVIQSTQKSAASPQAQVVRYRIEAQLKKIKGKWLLSGISGR